MRATNELRPSFLAIFKRSQFAVPSKHGVQLVLMLGSLTCSCLDFYRSRLNKLACYGAAAAAARLTFV